MADGSAPDVPVERLRRKVVRNHRAGRSLTPKPGSTAERQMRAALELDGIELREELREVARSRPRTFGECKARGLGTAENPCPCCACTYHLALDLDVQHGPRRERGHIYLNRPDAGMQPRLDGPTCALAQADAGRDSYEEIGQSLGVSRQRAEQIVSRAVAKLALRHPEMRAALAALRESPEVWQWHGRAPIEAPHGDLDGMGVGIRRSADAIMGGAADLVAAGWRRHNARWQAPEGGHWMPIGDALAKLRAGRGA